MEKNMDKSLLFMTLSAVCIWLVVDVALGKNYLGGFLVTLFPFMSDDNSSKGLFKSKKEVETVQETAPSSSAIGSNKSYGGERVNGNYSTNGQIVGDSYRKN